MNKQHIRNLAEKSGIELTSNGFNVYTEFASLSDLEKFAELIVSECLDFCRHEPNEDPYDSYDIGYDSATQNIRKAIQTHFGVQP